MYTTDLQIIGKRLKEYRESMGLSQPQAAELAQISERTLYKAENGIGEMKILTLLQICNGWNIPALELLRNEKETPDYKSEITNCINACSEDELKRIFHLIHYALRIPH